MGEVKKIIGNVTKFLKLKRKILVIAVVAVIVVLLAGFKWTVDSTATEVVAKIATEQLEAAVSIEGKHWKIDDGIYENIKNELKAKGLDINSFGGGNTKYLEKIVKAELVTNYPNLGEEVDIDDKNKFQGIVNFIRRDAEGTTDGELMEYMPEEDFNEYIAKGDFDSIRNSFTIDFGTNGISGNTGANASGTYRGRPINYYADFAALSETPEELGLAVSKEYSSARTTTYGPDAAANSGYEGKTCVPGIDLLEGMKIAAKPIRTDAKNYNDVELGDWIYVENYGYFIVSDIGDAARKK